MSGKSPRRCAGWRWTRRPPRPARRSTSMAPALSADPNPSGSRPGTHWIVWVFAVVGVLGALAFIMLASMIFGLGTRQEPAAVVAEASAVRFVVRDATPIRGT